MRKKEFRNQRERDIVITSLLMGGGIACLIAIFSPPVGLFTVFFIIVGIVCYVLAYVLIKEGVKNS